MNPLIVIIPLLLLLGGSATQAVREKNQLKDAHKTADAAVANAQSLDGAVTKLKGDVKDLQVTQAQKDADNARQFQIIDQYLVAAGVSLDLSNIPYAKQFVGLGVQVVPPSADTLVKGTALAKATPVEKDALVAELQREVSELKADVATKAAKLEVVNATVNDDEKTLAAKSTENLSLVKAVDQQTAEKKDLASQIGDITAKYGREVFWIALAAGIAWVAFHVLLYFHVSLSKTHSAVVTSHALVSSQLAAEVAAHNATKSALVQSLTATPIPLQPPTTGASGPA